MSKKAIEVGDDKRLAITDFEHCNNILAGEGISIRHNTRFNRIEVIGNESSKFQYRDWIEVDDDVLTDIQLLIHSVPARYKVPNKFKLREQLRIISGRNRVDPVIDKFIYLQRRFNRYGKDNRQIYMQVFNNFASKYFVFPTKHDEIIANWSFRFIFVAIAVLSIRAGEGGVTDKVPVWIGKQGLGKTRILQMIGDILADGVYSDQGHLNKRDKEVIESMYGVGLVEIPDGVGILAGDIRRHKAFISKRVFKARLAYGATVTTMKRKDVLVATENEVECLNQDPTGQRRYAPFLTLDYKQFPECRDGTANERMKQALLNMEVTIPMMLGIAYDIVANDDEYLTVSRDYLTFNDELKASQLKATKRSESTNQTLEASAQLFKEVKLKPEEYKQFFQDGLEHQREFPTLLDGDHQFHIYEFVKFHYSQLGIDVPANYSDQKTHEYAIALKSVGAISDRNSKIRFWYFDK